MFFHFLPWLLGLGLVVLGWWSAIGARTRARRAAIRACEKAEVLFIDELAFRGIGPGRDAGGRLCLKRRYAFEFYCRGDLRYAGRVEVHGQRVTQVHLDPHP